MSDKTRLFLISLLFLSFFCAPVSSAQDTAKDSGAFDSIEALIEILKEKGVMSDEEAGRLLERHRKTGVPRQAGKGTVIIFPAEQEEAYVRKVTERVTQDLRKDVSEVREDLSHMSDELMKRSRNTDHQVEALDRRVNEDLARKLGKASWAQRIRWGGDIRLRYQTDRFDENNADILRPDQPDALLNTKVDRDRFRYRLRVGMKAEVMEKDPEKNVGKVDAVLRLATGNEDDPVSTNDTFGDYLTNDGVVIEQAYLNWTYGPDTPKGGLLPELSLTGGRMPNPWFSTNLLWDDDLNFEGAALAFQSDTRMEKPWKGFLTLGAFPIQEEEWSDRDKWLYAAQVGVRYERSLGVSWGLGLAYYDFKNMQGVPNDPLLPAAMDFTAPRFQQKGNTLIDIDPSADIKTALASDYNLLNITGELDIDIWFPYHVILTADYVKNLGFDRGEVAVATGYPDVPEATEGYHIGVTVGHPRPRAFGEWNAFLFYKYLESDAVLDAYTDSDFHLGGTNAQGWILGANFGFSEALSLRARWLTSDQIDGPPLAIDVLQVDLSARY